MRILIASSIDPDAIGRLAERHEVTQAFNAPESELQALVSGQEILVFRSGVSISRRVLEAAGDLRLVIRAGSGLDNLDLAELERRGIPLARIPRPSSQAVAELTFALMLALSRNLLQVDGLLRRGQWAKHTFENFLVSGKTLGVLGAGNIGARVGQLGHAWGMRVLGCVAEPTREAAARLAAMGIELTSMDEAVAQADFLSLHVPLTEATRGLVGAEMLGKMKPGSYLVNTARGGIVDEAALLEALRSGERLRGAALDVHEQEGPGRISPLRDLPNVILTPHVGASTVDTQREIGREIVEIIESFERPRPDATAAGHEPLS